MDTQSRWWREWQYWAVLAIVAAIYLTRLGDAMPGGEEPRRGQVAREMIRSGDWLVPRQQGELFLSRPPVQNWAIAAVALIRGRVDAWAIRIPSGVAMLFSATLIYVCSRRYLTRLGAMSAMIAFPTMGLTLQFGWLGETEAIYTVFVAGSLLLWREADAAGHPLAAWCVGYALAGLGMLTKGPQAPVYFIAGTALCLLASRRWRELFRWQHAAGVAVFLAVWLAWEVPFYQRVGSQAAWAMLCGDIGMRFQDQSWARAAWHFVEFPLGVAACMLPWCLFLLAWCWRDFRRGIEFAKDDVRFLALAVGFAILSCYMVPGARNRYVAPVFPLVAPLVGLAAQQCCAAAAGVDLVRLRRRFFIGMAVLTVALAGGIVAATLFHFGPTRGQQRAIFAAIYVFAAASAATVMLWASRRPGPLRQTIGTLAVGAFLGLSYMGANINSLVAKRQPIDRTIAAVMKDVPPDVELVSIGPVDDIFLFYCDRPIKRLPLEAGVGRQEPAWTYFCMGCGPVVPPFGYPYEKLGVVSVEAGYSEHPRDVVVVGQRMPGTLAARKSNMK